MDFEFCPPALGKRSHAAFTGEPLRRGSPVKGEVRMRDVDLRVHYTSPVEHVLTEPCPVPPPDLQPLSILKRRFQSYNGIEGSPYVAKPPSPWSPYLNGWYSPDNSVPWAQDATQTQPAYFKDERIRISPTNQRKIISPTTQRSPISCQRPAPTTLYPELSLQTEPARPTDDSHQEQRALRHIGGTFVSILGFVPRWIKSALRFFQKPQRKAYIQTQSQQEIVALETDSSGRKRRAVAADTSPAQHLTQSPVEEQTSPMPGGYPDLSSEMAMPSEAHATESAEVQTETPPDSRPTSNKECEKPFEGEVLTQNSTAQTSQVESNEHQESIPEEMTTHTIQSSNNQHYSHVSAYKTANDAEEDGDDEDPNSYANVMARIQEDIEYRTRRANYTYKLSQKRTKARQPPDSIPPLPAHYVDAVAARKSEPTVGSLVDRVQKISIGESERKSLRQSTRIRDQRKAKEEDEQMKAEEAAKRAEAEAARKAEEEAAAKKAEEELAKAKEAEEVERKLKEKVVDKDQLVRPMDKKWEETLRSAMASRNGAHVLVRGANGVELTRYDLGRILPQRDDTGHSIEGTLSGTHHKMDGPAGWLNDEAVNAWLATIVSRKLEQRGYKRGTGVPPFAAFNAQWFTNYQTKGGAPGIRNWAKRQKIDGTKLLQVERIFFPACVGGAHWILLIISPKERKLEVLDSMGGSRKKYFEMLRDFLEMELGKDYIPDEWTESKVRSESQMNSDDCGVFVCLNALASAKNKPFSDVPARDDMVNARRMIVAVLLNQGFHGDWDL